MEQILKQTIESGYLYLRVYEMELWRYLCGGFTISATSTRLSIDDRIAAAFCTAFTDLRKAFDLKHCLSMALVLSRAITTIDAMSGYISS